MITFKEYLAEDITQLSPFIKLVKRDCQPFLKSADDPLYRGINTEKSTSVKGMGPYAIKGTVRKDRRRKDSNSRLHDAANKGLAKAFGVDGRSESLFCSFSGPIADQYGGSGHASRYLIFPIGPVSYIWSPIMADLYDVFDQSWGEWSDMDGIDDMVETAIAELDLRNQDGKYMDKMDVEPEDRDDIVDYIFQHHTKDLYTMDDTYSGPMTHEVMVLCDHYYGIRVKDLETEFDVGAHELLKACKK